MAIRFNPVGEINFHGKNLALSQSVRKMNFSSRKLAENQAGRDSSQQLAVSSYQLVVGGVGARNNIQESRFWPPILRMLFCDGPLELFRWSRYLKRPHKESDNYPHGFDKHARYSLIFYNRSGRDYQSILQQLEQFLQPLAVVFAEDPSLWICATQDGKVPSCFNSLTNCSWEIVGSLRRSAITA